jgi:hypothetical protein
MTCLRWIYIIVLRWILNRLWDVDWVIMNLGCWWRVVWGFWRIYCCILFNVIVTNGCMNITKHLRLYFIECNRDKWLYEYYEGSTIYYILNCNCDEWLYEYYERSTIVLYLMLMNMNGCMGITRDLLLYCIEH